MGNQVRQAWSLLVVGAFLGTAAYATPPGQKTDAQYWAETGLRFQTLREHLSNEKCHQSAVHFVGCVMGLDAAAEMAEPRGLQLVAASLLGATPETSGAVIQMHGPLALIERTKKVAAEEKSFILFFNERKAREARQIEALQAVYATRTAERPFVVNFDELIDVLRSRATNAKNEALVAAVAMNTYLESAIDPHTHINPSAQIEESRSSTGTTFFGIGVELKTIGKVTTIVNVFEGSPALAAGIKARDIFHQIGNESAYDMKIEDVVSRVMGPEGTLVDLVMKRGDQLIPITVKRGRITQAEAYGKMVNDADHKFIYLRLRGFMSTKSCEILAQATVRLAREGAEGIILDLRGNPGGLMSQGICLTGIFVGQQVVLQVKDLQENSALEPIPAQNGKLTNLPMITLIDGGSASASEIVAGALQDHRRSWIAGDRSYGKATVQGPSDWTAAGVVIYETVQRFYQPSGRTNQIVGIQPDFAIDPSPNATEDEKFMVREADAYKNALPPLGEPWQQPRPAEVAKIQNCAKSGRALETFKSRADAAIPPDYRLLVAQDLLACAIQ